MYIVYSPETDKMYLMEDIILGSSVFDYFIKQGITLEYIGKL